MRLIAIILSYLKSIIKFIWELLIKILIFIFPFLQGFFDWITKIGKKLGDILPFIPSVDENVYDATTEWMKETPYHWEKVTDVALMFFIGVGAVIVFRSVLKGKDNEQ